MQSNKHASSEIFVLHCGTHFHCRFRLILLKICDLRFPNELSRVTAAENARFRDNVFVFLARLSLFHALRKKPF
jgi:hypothetical protein